MKAFIKILFTLLFIILAALNSSQTVEAFSAFIHPESCLQIVSKDCETEKDSYITKVSTEDYVIAPASSHYELYAPTERRDSFSFWNGEFLYTQNRIAQFIRSAVLFRSCNGTFHNLSSYLKNEICVRAP